MGSDPKKSLPYSLRRMRSGYLRAYAQGTMERGHLALAEDRMSSFPALFTEIRLLACRPTYVQAPFNSGSACAITRFWSVLGNNHESLLGGASDQGNGRSGRPTIEGDPEPRSKLACWRNLSKREGPAFSDSFSVVDK